MYILIIFCQRKEQCSLSLYLSFCLSIYYLSSIIHHPPSIYLSIHPLIYISISIYHLSLSISISSYLSSSSITSLSSKYQLIYLWSFLYCHFLCGSFLNSLFQENGILDLGLQIHLKCTGQGIEKIRFGFLGINWWQTFFQGAISCISKLYNWLRNF